MCRIHQTSVVVTFVFRVRNGRQLHAGGSGGPRGTSWRLRPSREATLVREHTVREDVVVVTMQLLGVGLAAMGLATCLAGVHVSVNVSTTESETSTVIKTVFSSKLRLVMMVGAEGTGHGFMVEVKEHMFRTNDQLLQVPGRYMITSQRDHIRTSMAATALGYSSNLDAAKADMRKLAEHGALLQFPGTIALFRKKNSYPDGHPPDKVLKYVDLRMLAEVAEEEGVDLRVIYLKRPVKDLIIADTVHRHFQL